MFNFLQILKKKFLSFKKSYKLNIFYFKNKKSNFISSLSNYARTNKTKTWTNSLVKLFNFKTNSKTLLMYVLNTIIIVLFIYFEKSAIIDYFTNVFPYEIKLNMLTYQFILSWVLELLLNFWWIIIFFINNNFINFIVFLDSNILSLANMTLKPYFFNFEEKKSNDSSQTPHSSKKKWAELSKKTFSCFNNKLESPLIIKNNPLSCKNNYSELRKLTFEELTFYTVNKTKQESNFFNKINLFLSKTNMFSKSFLVSTISQKNLIANNQSKNKTIDPIIWYLNRNENLTKLNYTFLLNCKKIIASSYFFKHNTGTKTQLITKTILQKQFAMSQLA